MNITPHHAKYYAWELTRRRAAGEEDRAIREDQKSHALLTALQQGFERMAGMGAAQKAVIFTESRRTQDYLARFLEAHGHAGKVVTFSGGNQGEAVTGIYQRWLAKTAVRIASPAPLPWTGAPPSSTSSGGRPTSSSPPKPPPKASTSSSAPWWSTTTCPGTRNGSNSASAAATATGKSTTWWSSTSSTRKTTPTGVCWNSCKTNSTCLTASSAPRMPSWARSKAASTLKSASPRSTTAAAPPRPSTPPSPRCAPNSKPTSRRAWPKPNACCWNTSTPTSTPSCAATRNGRKPSSTASPARLYRLTHPLARAAQSMDEARKCQDDIRRVEGDQRRQRQEIFAVEDDIEARRDALIDTLEKRLHQASRRRALFTVRWAVE